jgi:hypothetical protein
MTGWRQLEAAARVAALVCLTASFATAGPRLDDVTSLLRQAAAPTLTLKDSECAVTGSGQQFTLQSVGSPGNDPAAPMVPRDVTCRFAATTPAPPGAGRSDPHLLRVRAMSRSLE